MAGRIVERLELPRKLRRAVERLARSASKPHRLVLRGKMIRMALDGLSNAEVGGRVGVTAQTVAKWPKRIASERKMTALDDPPRSGRFHFVYPPKHASWVNQIELGFSILQRRVLRYGSFASKRALSASVVSFIRHWNLHEAHPFRWTFRDLLKSLLALLTGDLAWTLAPRE